MTQEVAEKNLQTWFWTFKEKMVDEHPEYAGTFDYVVQHMDSTGVLYEFMELAYKHLEVDAMNKGGMDNLSIKDYLEAIDYGYMCCTNAWGTISLN